MRFDQEDLRALAAAAGQRSGMYRRARPSYWVPLATAGMLAGLVVLFWLYLSAHRPASLSTPPTPSSRSAAPIAPGLSSRPASRPARAIIPPRIGPQTAPSKPAVQLKLASAAIRRLPLRPRAEDREGIFDFPPAQPLSPPLLVLAIELHNGSAQAIEYRPGHPPLLVDDGGRSYAMLVIADAVIEGQQTRNTKIAPGESIRDVLLFEPAPADAGKLTLRLVGESVGQAQGIELTIPVQRLHHQGDTIRPARHPGNMN